MILRVPFYKQEEKNDCGPIALKMVLEFLGEKHSIEELRKRCETESSGVTWTAGIAKAAAELGFGVEFYSKHIDANHENYSLDFYKKETDGEEASKEKVGNLLKKCIELGVKVSERVLELDEVLDKINENCTAIILLDWGKIKGEVDFTGHFVPITGYDKEKVYVHNQGFINPTENLAISIDKFEEARKAKGTDEDIIFIHRKV